MGAKPNITNEAFCLECGQSLGGESLEGFCPRCLSRLAFDTDTETAHSSTEITRSVGDYELIEEIGRGGMGVVWKARQRSLDRVIALKFILAGSFASREFIDRFRAEATAAARLKHPNIVAVHEVGEDEGHHYFSMDFIEGRNLTQLVRDEPPSLRQAARYLRLIAEAIHHAHERGIVHRDLKPSNILVDNSGEPHITDFGLARELNSNEHLTLTGQALGSPSFAAPEQISGRLLSSAAGGPIESGSQSTSHAAAHQGAPTPLTRSVDIYALGTLLYYLLTGRPPFVGLTLAKILRAVQEDEPVRPRVLNPEISRDLETICLKCMEKEPGRRYATAQELADELGRFLDNEPIRARPVSSPEKLWRWCRHKPALATLGAAALSLLLVVILGAPIAIVRINRALLEAERDLYAAHMTLASEAFRNGAIGQVQELLDRHKAHQGAGDLPGFEWRYLAHAVQQSTLLAHHLFRPEGAEMTEVAAAGGILYNFNPGTSQVLAWDMANWAPLALKLPALPTSEWWWRPWQQAVLALDQKHRTISVYRLPGFEEAGVITVPGEASQAALTQDQRTLAVGFRAGDVHRILVWDLVANVQHRILGEYSGKVTRLVFSPNGAVLMAACEDGEIQLWSIPQGNLLPSPLRDSSRPEEAWDSAPFFAPDSARLFLNRDRERKTLQVWDWSSAKPPPAYRARLGRLHAFGFSPDGAVLATAGSDGVIALLDTKELRPIGLLPVNGATIQTLAFSPSGRFLASGGKDRSVRLWDVKALRELKTLGGNHDEVLSVAFAPDEKSLLARLNNGALKVWNLHAILSNDLLWRTTNTIEQFTVSPGERAIATADSLGWVHICDLSGVEIRKVHSGEPDSAATSVSMAFSPKTHVVAWAGCNWFGILDYESGQTKTVRISGRSGYCNPAFAPNGRELAFASPTNIMIWDMAGQTPWPFALITNSALCLAFSPDGSLLAAAHEGGTLTLWERESGRTITNTPAHSNFAFGVEFSPNGRLLASIGSDAIGKIWDVLPNGSGLKLRHTLRGHIGWMGAVAFSPDSRRVVTSSNDDAVKIWDVETGLEVGTIYGHHTQFAGFAFSRDGNGLYWASKDGEVRIWPAPPLEQSEAPPKEKKVRQ